MAREWCVVVELSSALAARKLWRVLRKEGFDTAFDGNPAQVWCFAEGEREARVFGEHAVALAGENGLDEKLAGEPTIRGWSDDEQRYVVSDPGASRLT